MDLGLTDKVLVVTGMIGAQNFAALGAGLSVGMLFSWLKLPLPAPPTLTEIIGAAGVFLGSVIFRWLVPA